MSDAMTADKALARIMELHKISPGHDVLRKDLRPILAALHSAGWQEGYREGLADEMGR